MQQELQCLLLYIWSFWDLFCLIFRDSKRSTSYMRQFDQICKKTKWCFFLDQTLIVSATYFLVTYLQWHVVYFYVGSKCLTYLKSKSEIADSEFARVEPLFFFSKCQKGISRFQFKNSHGFLKLSYLLFLCYVEKLKLNSLVFSWILITKKSE